MFKALFKLLPLGVIGGVASQGNGDVKEKIDKALNIVQIAMTEAELAGQKTVLIAYYREKRRLPTQGEYGKFIRENMMTKSDTSTRDVASDSWGTPFKYSNFGTGFEVRSCGPDKSCGGKDDVVSRMTGLDKVQTLGIPGEA